MHWLARGLPEHGRLKGQQHMMRPTPPNNLCVVSLWVYQLSVLHCIFSIIGLHHTLSESEIFKPDGEEQEVNMGLQLHMISNTGKTFVSAYLLSKVNLLNIVHVITSGHNCQLWSRLCTYQEFPQQHYIYVQSPPVFLVMGNCPRGSVALALPNVTVGRQSVLGVGSWQTHLSLGPCW